MRLYKVKRSPYWQHDVTWNGKRRRVSTKRTDRQEAMRVALSYLRKLQDRDQLGARESATFAQLVETYLPRIKAEGLADYRNIEQRCRKLMGKPPFEAGYHLPPTMLVEELTTAHVVRLRTDRLASGASAGTVNNELRCLRRLHNVAREMGYAVNADVRFELLEERENTRWLSADEARRLLDELDPDRTVGYQKEAPLRSPLLRRRLTDQYELTVLLLDSGLRYGELVNLRWSEVDTETFRTLQIYRTKTGTAGRIDLPDRSVNILLGRFKLYGTLPYVFPGSDRRGRPTRKPRTHATQGIRRAIERAGLNTPESIKRHGRCTVHSLRHTYASTLVQNGASLFEVQTLLGHSSPAMTKRYAVLEAGGVADKARNILNRVHQKAL